MPILMLQVRYFQHEWLCPDEAMVRQVGEDSFTILAGPSDELKGYFVHLALADLQRLLKNSKKAKTQSKA